MLPAVAVALCVLARPAPVPAPPGPAPGVRELLPASPLALVVAPDCAAAAAVLRARRSGRPVWDRAPYNALLAQVALGPPRPARRLVALARDAAGLFDGLGGAALALLACEPNREPEWLLVLDTGPNRRLARVAYGLFWWLERFTYEDEIGGVAVWRDSDPLRPGGEPGGERLTLLAVSGRFVLAASSRRALAPALARLRPPLLLARARPAPESAPKLPEAPGALLVAAADPARLQAVLDGYRRAGRRDPEVTSAAALARFVLGLPHAEALTAELRLSPAGVEFRAELRGRGAPAPLAELLGRSAPAPAPGGGPGASATLALPPAGSRAAPLGRLLDALHAARGGLGAPPSAGPIGWADALEGLSYSGAGHLGVLHTGRRLDAAEGNAALAALAPGLAQLAPPAGFERAGASRLALSAGGVARLDGDRFAAWGADRAALAGLARTAGGGRVAPAGGAPLRATYDWGGPAPLSAEVGARGATLGLVVRQPLPSGGKSVAAGPRAP